MQLNTGHWRLWKQIFLTLSVVAVVFSFGAGEYVRNTELSHLQSQYKAQNEKTFQLLTVTAIDAVISHDIPVLETIVQQAGKSDPAINDMRILDVAGELLAEWHRQNETPPRKTISFSSKIVFEGETFGHIELTWNTEDILKNIDSHVNLIRYSVMLSIVILIMTVTALVQILVINPVKNINARLLEDQSEASIKNINLPGYTASELMRLNESVSQLEKEWKRSRQQELELQMARDELEEKVQERTKNLEDANQNLKREIEERERAEEVLQKTQLRLMQASKMESLGTLAGGVAHEINTPVHYIGNNIQFLGESFEDLRTLMKTYENLASTASQNNVLADQTKAVAAAREEADIEFLEEEVPMAAKQALEGVKQITSIVMAMKEFSHPSRKEKHLADINKLIERAATVSRGEWKHTAELELGLDPSLPPVAVLEGELNQVFLSLIVNASQAIEESAKTDGKIIISSLVSGNSIQVCVTDNGPGIPNDILNRIFDPFFTTKTVGKGSGQGLSIVYDIIVNKHQGEIYVNSTEGHGATFTIELPIEAA